MVFRVGSISCFLLIVSPISLHSRGWTLLSSSLFNRSWSLFACSPHAGAVISPFAIDLLLIKEPLCFMFPFRRPPFVPVHFFPTPSIQLYNPVY